MHADMISRLEDSFTSGEEIEYLREKDRENERIINRLTATAQAKVKAPPSSDHIEPQEMSSEFYQQMEAIVERTIRRVREEERRAGFPPLENDNVHDQSDQENEAEARRGPGKPPKWRRDG